jgi:putative spermidine/putrescine transport system permease protein
LGFPFVVIMCATALSGIRPSIEQAAQSLGARRVKRLLRITIPLIFPSVLIGALVAFQTSFDEIVIALFLSGVQTRTLPKAMWQASTLEVTPMIPAVAVIVLVLILVLALVIFGIARAIRPGTHKSA